MRVFKTEAKQRFLHHEDSRAWFLTDKENGMIYKPPEPLFICKYDVVQRHIEGRFLELQKIPFDSRTISINYQSEKINY